MTDLSSRAGIMVWRKAERRRLTADRLVIDAGDGGRHVIQILANLECALECGPGDGSIELKRQVAQEFIAGETLHGLAKRRDTSRNLIHIWVANEEPFE